MHWMTHGSLAFLGGLVGIALWYPATCLPAIFAAPTCQNFLGQTMAASAAAGWEAKAGGLALLGAIASIVWERVSPRH